MLEAGERSTQDLLDAENTAVSAELDQARMRAELFIQHLRLAALAGGGRFSEATATLAKQ